MDSDSEVMQLSVDVYARRLVWAAVKWVTIFCDFLPAIGVVTCMRMRNETIPEA